MKPKSVLIGRAANKIRVPASRASMKNRAGGCEVATTVASAEPPAYDDDVSSFASSSGLLLVRFGAAFQGAL